MSMTRSPRPSPAVQLARDVLHWHECESHTCKRCNVMLDGIAAHPATVTLARALLRAVRK